MKPLATLNRPVLKTVDVVTKEETVSFKERTDVTAVPAMGVVAETMVALVLADEALRKFGGDSVAEFVRNRARRIRRSACDHLVLVGMMGSGKTTVGRHLSDRLGWHLVDSDAEIEARTGRTVREIFEHDGEPAFRSLETDALRDALDAPGPTIVAAAGGVVLTEANRDAARASERHGRVAAGGTRAPRGAGRDAATTVRCSTTTPQACWPSMAVERDPLYREVADVVVDVDGLSPDEVADRVLAAVGALITVPRAARTIAPYDVLVGAGARHELAAVLPAECARVAVVTQARDRRRRRSRRRAPGLHDRRRRGRQVARDGRGPVPPVRAAGA